MRDLRREGVLNMSSVDVTLRDLDAYYDVRVTTCAYIKSQPHLVSRLHHLFFLSYSI